jgi:hypothetical protein
MKSKPSPLRHGTLALFAAVAVALGASGCSTLPRSQAPGVDRAELLRSAMFDHDCPAERIWILGSDTDSSGNARFQLDVCGTKRTYKRVGTLYFDADRTASRG